MASPSESQNQFNALIEKLTLGQKISMMIALPLLFELLFVGALLFSLNQLEAESDKSQSTRAASLAYNVEMQTMYEIMGSMVLFNVLHDSHYREQFENSVNFLKKQNTRLKDLGGSELATDAKALQVVSEEAVTNLSEIEALAKSDDRTDILRGFVKVQRLLKKATALGAKYIAREADVTDLLNKERNATRQQIKLVIVLGVAISILLSILLLVVFGRVMSKQVAAIDENMLLLAGRKELNKPLRGKDELARVDQTLVDLSKELEVLRHQQQQMYAMITHDLRSPIGTLTLMFDLFDAGAFGELNEKGKQRIKATTPVLNKLVTLTNDLLDVEKFESGTLELEKQTVELHPLLTECASIVSVRAESKNIQVEVAPTNLKATCDRERVARVVANFLDNAIKFSGHGSQIHISATEQGDGRVKVAVQDGGRGISTEVRESIFERFRQGDEKGGNKEKGFGLGLAICKAIVLAHGGEIGVDSVVGEGSTFWFTLPA